MVYFDHIVVLTTIIRSLSAWHKLFWSSKVYCLCTHVSRDAIDLEKDDLDFFSFGPHVDQQLIPGAVTISMHTCLDHNLKTALLAYGRLWLH